MYWNKSFKNQQRQEKEEGLRKRVWKQDGERNRAKKKRTYLTFKHCELGTGVDLASAVGGCALVNGFVSVCAQRLDPQYGARAIIKLNHLGKPEPSKRPGMLFQGPLFLFQALCCNI